MQLNLQFHVFSYWFLDSCLSFFHFVVLTVLRFTSTDRLLIYVYWLSTDLRLLIVYWFTSTDCLLIYVYWSSTDLRLLIVYWFTSTDCLLIYVYCLSTDCLLIYVYWSSTDLRLLIVHLISTNYSLVWQVMHLHIRVALHLYINVLYRILAQWVR
jgi:hypothetical protein